MHILFISSCTSPYVFFLIWNLDFWVIPTVVLCTYRVRDGLAWWTSFSHDFVSCFICQLCYFTLYTYRIYSNGRRTPFSSRPRRWAKGKSSRPRIDATFNYIHNTFRGCGDESIHTCPLAPVCLCANALCDKWLLHRRSKRSTQRLSWRFLTMAHSIPTATSPTILAVYRCIHNKRRPRIDAVPLLTWN